MPRKEQHIEPATRQVFSPRSTEALAGARHESHRAVCLPEGVRVGRLSVEDVGKEEVHGEGATCDEREEEEAAAEPRGAAICGKHVRRRAPIL